MNNPLLSIITINYNNADGLRKTLESVRIQDDLAYEHIIVDGGSTDSSVQVIEEYLKDATYSKHVSFWCSEKDKGIYNAMNKGISHANGEYCLILNSSDILHDKDVIKNVLPHLDGSDMITGIMQMDAYSKLPEKDYSLFSYMDSYIAHGATFVKTEICRELPYDESYKIIADYVFFYNVLNRKNLTYKNIDLIIESFDLTGISAQRPPLQDQELNRFYESIMPKLAWKDYEFYNRFAFFDKAIAKSSFWHFVYRVCRKLVHVFMKIG